MISKISFSSIKNHFLFIFHIFDLFSETAGRKSPKLHRKQVLNIFYQVFIFPADRKKQDGRSGLWLADIFYFLSGTAERKLSKFKRNQELNVLYQVCGVFFSGRSKNQELNVLYHQVCVFFGSIKKDGHPGLWLAYTFSTSSLKQLNGICRNLPGSKISTFSVNFVYYGHQDSVLLRHFQLLLWTEFKKKTWQEKEHL